jgi:hypothetical protein
MTLAQLLKREPLPPGQVLLDALHDAESILADARTRVSVDDETTAQDMARFIESLERAAKLAKVALDTGLMERVVLQRERDNDAIGKMLSDVLVFVVDLWLDHAGMPVSRRREWRTWALTTAQTRLLEVAGDATNAGYPPPPPSDARVVDSYAVPELEADALATVDGA